LKILGIIPARYASTRFPGKPLADIGGKSMIRRVYEQCRKAECLTDVVVATDDQRIFDHVLGFEGKVVMTSAGHGSGTERCREALQIVSKDKTATFDAVINIQGDEPFISPLQIELVGQLLAEPKTNIATLVKRITAPEEIWDPNVVKAVLNRYREALYFSRSPIPFLRGKEKHDWPGSHIFYKHIGIYGYKSDILERLPELEATPLETAESLEQLRWLGWGLKIRTAETDIESISIDTPSDLLKITNIA
jgi:3-deoxy-manno-octulosonate cytidylyltransferase (CMP-KDO synthetase)